MSSAIEKRQKFNFLEDKLCNYFLMQYWQELKSLIQKSRDLKLKEKKNNSDREKRLSLRILNPINLSSMKKKNHIIRSLLNMKKRKRSTDKKKNQNSRKSQYQNNQKVKSLLQLKFNIKLLKLVQQ